MVVHLCIVCTLDVMHLAISRLMCYFASFFSFFSGFTVHVLLCLFRAASFYGHSDIVACLLMFGASYLIENNMKQPPFLEAKEKAADVFDVYMNEVRCRFSVWLIC